MDALAELNAILSDRYRVDREIGRGGMATVYLARDVRHDRLVALKVLNPELGAVLGVDRFLAEIRVTANLQHPNLLPLFDSGEANGLLYYVMPFVEGETLRARLDRERQLPVDEALRLAAAVASALDYAHRHGVIHRDLKPENILLHEGQPLVADFGIALAVSNAGGSRVTQTGLSLGTPQYMSPEQASGDRVIDGRTDVYSLGAVLYEMLTGDPPHTGSTAQSVIARLMTERPRPIRVTRAAVPVDVERAIARALEKLPADRWPNAQQFGEALAVSRPLSAADAFVGSGAVRVRHLWPAVIGVVGIAIAAYALARHPAEPATRARFVVVPPDTAHLPDAASAPGRLLALSPDGTRLAFVGGTPSRIYVRSLNDLVARPLPGTEDGHSPQFSPDGQWLAFVADQRLKKVPLTSGAPVNIAEGVHSYSWGERDVIVIGRPTGPNTGLWRVSPAGEAPQRVTQADSFSILHAWPVLLPGGKAAVFSIRTGAAEYDSLAVVRLDDGRITRLGIQGMSPLYSRTGHLLFGRADGTVAAVPFDANRLVVTGPATPVLENVGFRGGGGESGGMQFAIADNGTMAYVRGRTTGQLTYMDLAGHTAALRPQPDDYMDPRFSPDGKRLAMTIRSGGHSDVWIETIETGIMSRLTNDGVSDRPNWTADGRLVVWRVRGSGTAFDLDSASWDGSSSGGLFLHDAWTAVFASSGKFAAVNTVRPGSSSDIDLLTLAPAVRRQPFLNSRMSEMSPRISPDGNWLAFADNQSGRYEVYVRSLFGSPGLHQITTGGGGEPMWSPSGRALFVRSGGKLLSVSLATAPAFMIVRSDTLMADDFRPGSNYANYDVTPDGKRLLIIKLTGAQEPPVVVLGWSDELRERVKAAVNR